MSSRPRAGTGPRGGEGGGTRARSRITCGTTRWGRASRHLPSTESPARPCLRGDAGSLRGAPMRESGSAAKAAVRSVEWCRLHMRRSTRGVFRRTVATQCPLRDSLPPARRHYPNAPASATRHPSHAGRAGPSGRDAAAALPKKGRRRESDPVPDLGGPNPFPRCRRVVREGSMPPGPRACAPWKNQSPASIHRPSREARCSSASRGRPRPPKTGHRTPLRAPPSRQSPAGPGCPLREVRGA